MTVPPSARLPSPAAPGPALPRRRRSLVGDCRGIAALEMAIIAPSLLIAVLGLYSTVEAVRVKLLLNTATASMATLVASQDTVVSGPGGNLTDLCTYGASNSLLPYATKPVMMTVARYTRPSNGNVSGPDWHSVDACPTSSNKPMGGTETALANSVLMGDADTNPSVIVVKASYAYKPAISFNPTFGVYIPAFTMTATRYEKARNVHKANCPTCPQG